MSRDVLTVGSTMRIPLLFWGEYSQWSERFMNYLKEQTDEEAMINSIKNGDQPLPRVTQVSIARISSTEQPPLKDKSMCNKTAKDLWDALARHMLGFEYGEQDRKAAVLYEYKTFNATEGELLLDTYIRYLQVINDLKKCGYSKDNCEVNFKFLNNLQPEWKQYATMMRQNKNLMDINTDALYNILKQNQRDVNDAMGLKKKTVVITSDPLALIAEKAKVNKRKEKVVVSSDSEGSDEDDFNELKKVTSLLAKDFNQKNFYSKPTNNNLRTSPASNSANKKQEYVKSDDKKVEEKKRDMSKVKCYNCKKEGHFAKDCKKAKVKDYDYCMTKMLLDKKDKDKQILLVEDHTWMESSSDFDQEINANMVFMAQMEKVLSDSEKSSSSFDETITGVAQICLWIIDSGCLKHMMGNRALLTNIVEKFPRTVRFGNNDFAMIAGYGDVVIGSMTIKRVYYVEGLAVKGDIRVFVGYAKDFAPFRVYNKRTHKIHESVNVNFDKISEMAFKQFNLEPSLTNLNKKGKILNSTISQVEETSKKYLKDLFQKFYDEYFDSSKLKKSLTTNVETSNNEGEVFHVVSESFQRESSSSSLNDDVQQSPEEVILPQTNTQSISNDMIPNVNEASSSHNVFNERLEDTYFDASTTFHDTSDVYTYYQPYSHETKWTKDHPLYKTIGDPKSSVRTRGQLANLCLFACLLSSIDPANVAEASKDADWVIVMQDELYQFDFMVFQMNVKTTFLYGILKEEVYIGQPLGFVSKQYPDHVYTIDKAMYGLKQAPQAWYDVLPKFLIDSGFQKVLWMRTQLTDYGFFYDRVSVYCDSKSAIVILCNLVQHTRTKHIDVRYHFIKDHVEKGTIELYFVGTEYQLADLFMKSLPEARFRFLVEKLVIIDDTAEGEKNKKDNDANPAATQGKHQSDDTIPSSGPMVESQEEQPADPKVANKKSTSPVSDDKSSKDGPLSQEKIDEQLRELKRLEDLKAKNERSKQKLRKMFNPATLKAHAQKWTEHEAKIAKMIEEYNHKISFRANTLPITKISYVKRLGIPSPPELVTFGLTAEEKKRKRTEFIKEVFVTENIKVYGMDMKLTPPLGIMPIQDVVINEPESGIFFMYGNTDIGFKRKSEFY
nr:ribonuclease H [Tanacetum cinerariifolium]